MIRRQIRHIVFHTPHEVQSVFRESRNGKPSHVLRALHPDPVKHLKNRTNKSPGHPENPAIPSGKPGIHQKNLNPHLPCPPKHVRPDFILHKNQGGRTDSPECPEHGVIKIRGYVHQPRLRIHQGQSDFSSRRCSGRDQNSQIRPPGPQLPDQHPRQQHFPDTHRVDPNRPPGILQPLFDILGIMSQSFAQPLPEGLSPPDQICEIRPAQGKSGCKKQVVTDLQQGLRDGSHARGWAFP